MKIVCQGNPGDGYTYYGPFPDIESAIKWAENELLQGDWWIMPLNKPD